MCESMSFRDCRPVNTFIARLSMRWIITIIIIMHTTGDPSILLFASGCCSFCVEESASNSETLCSSTLSTSHTQTHIRLLAELTNSLLFGRNSGVHLTSSASTKFHENYNLFCSFVIVCGGEGGCRCLHFNFLYVNCECV